MSPEEKSARKIASKILRNMRYRAKKRDLEVADFTLNEIAEIVMTGKCEVTNRSFDHTVKSEYRAHPFLPSPDRVSPEVGYTRENVRWVMSWVNYARGIYSVEDFASWMKGVRW